MQGIGAKGAEWQIKLKSKFQLMKLKILSKNIYHLRPLST